MQHKCFVILGLVVASLLVLLFGVLILAKLRISQEYGENEEFGEYGGHFVYEHVDNHTYSLLPGLDESLNNLTVVGLLMLSLWLSCNVELQSWH